MLNRVAVVTTGGTIGSVFSTKSIVADTAGSRLLAEIDKMRKAKNLSIEVSPALEKMSENMAPTDWLVILKTIQQLIGRGIKSIIVTHGTDTMAYTAAALALYFNRNKSDVRICLTGAFYPLDHPETDARMNLEAAMEVVISKQITSGVYMTFRINPTEVGIYHGLEISPISFDSSAFRAIYGQSAGIFVAGQIQNLQPRVVDFEAECDFPVQQHLRTVGKHVYQIAAYPGLDLSIFAATPASRLLLIDGYHSGTASSERFAGTIIDFSIKHPQIKIALCCVPSKYVTLPYESTLAFVEAGINVYRDIPPLSLYVLASCRLAAGISLDRLLDPVSTARLRPQETEYRHAI